MPTPERPVAPTFSIEEAHALLWAVRNVDHEALSRSSYHGNYDQAAGYGALSSATNRLEEVTGEAMRMQEDRWIPVKRERLSDRHWRHTWRKPDGRLKVIDVRRLWWGYWINGGWCPTGNIALHCVTKLLEAP